MMWTAFILGLAGSLHCAGMCGPLVLALPSAGPGRSRFIIGRVVNNIGRLGTYTTIGAVFGLAGKIIAFAGWQRWLSIGTGLLLLLGLFAVFASLKSPAFTMVGFLRKAFSSLLRQRSLTALFFLGAINGLLPCGLVYVAAAAGMATGTAAGAILYMVFFGLGTLPMMLGIALAGRKLSIRWPVQRIVPATVAVVAILLILRGLSLGIPYLSPELASGQAVCPACH